MPNRRTQEAFTAFPFLSDGGINIHCHAPRADTLAVFVHGLAGDGYGTWGSFPEFLFESNIDVAVFDYPTALQRGQKVKSPPPSVSARLLSQEIRAIDGEYEHVFLLGHSMGGLVAGLAAHNYFEEISLDRQSSIMPLAGMLAFASPLGGSLSVKLPIASDLSFLYRGNKKLAAWRSYKEKKVDVEVSDYPNSNRYSFTTASLSGTNDIWVTRTNSALGIPPSQAEDCGGSHTELVKPPTREHKSVQWTVRTIAKTRVMRSRVRASGQESERASAGVSDQFVPGVLVVKLWDTSERSWHEAFTGALVASAERSTIRILDAREAIDTIEPSLIVRALHSSRVITRPELVKGELIDQFDSWTGRAQVALGPTGAEWAEAERTVKEWMAAVPSDQRPWVEGSMDASALREKIVEWIEAVAKKHEHTASSLPQKRRDDALRRASTDGTWGQPKRFGLGEDR